MLLDLASVRVVEVDVRMVIEMMVVMVRMVVRTVVMLVRASYLLERRGRCSIIQMFCAPAMMKEVPMANFIVN